MEVATVGRDDAREAARALATDTPGAALHEATIVTGEALTGDTGDKKDGPMTKNMCN